MMNQNLYYGPANIGVASDNRMASPIGQSVNGQTLFVNQGVPAMP